MPACANLLTSSFIPFSSSLVPATSDHCDNASNLSRPHKLRSVFTRDVWENGWIGQGTPGPLKSTEAIRWLGPEMGLKMEISRQKEMGPVPSCLSQTKRGTRVPIFELRYCTSGVVQLVSENGDRPDTHTPRRQGTWLLWLGPPAALSCLVWSSLGLGLTGYRGVSKDN